MRVRLIHCTTRSSGTIARREEQVSVESLFIGRGTDNDITLRGLTISLHHATIHQRGGQFLIHSEEGRDIRVNGRRVTSRRLEAGSVVQIGRFELRLLPTQAGEDLALEVVEAIERGDELEELHKRTTRHIEGGWLTRRKLSWAAVTGVLSLCLAAPFASPRLESIWISGDVSSSHGFFAQDCKACHGAFERVRDESCLECHSDITSHTQADFEVARLAGSRCASCHLEHTESHGLADIDQALCIDCHAEIERQLPSTTLAPTADFVQLHPEFRLFVVETPGAEARAAVWSPELRENSGLRFNHLRHVGRQVPQPTGDPEHLRCDACHTLDAAGMYMLPVSFEDQCSRCHELGFDERLPDALAPHGDAAQMRTAIARVYSDAVLRGEIQDARAPRAVRLARPGRELTSNEARVVSEWVDQQVERADRWLMKQPGECARCHELADAPAPDGGLDIAPLEVAEVWMPRSEFQHGTHSSFSCAGCHAGAAVYEPDEDTRGERPAWSVAGARPYELLTREEAQRIHGVAPSEDASDILIPGIERCRSCHAGGAGQRYRVTSECAMCHAFHREGTPPMRGPKKVAHRGEPGAYNRISSGHQGSRADPSGG
jgi:hypothetical protein